MVKSRLLAAVGIVAIVGGAVGVLTAQTPEGPKFEVASVRVAPPGMGNVSPYGQNRWSTGCVPLLLTREELRPRLKQLLEERFHLVAHVETHAVSGYALVLAKGGAKLHETTNPLTRTALGTGRIRAPSVSMDLFAGALGIVVHQPVTNETGLTGNYDLTLTFAPEGATDSALPSIFTALEEQLGLKVEGGRKVPVNTLVIDHVEHLTEY